MTTYIRLNQVRKADDFTDTLSASQIQNIESTSVDDEDFLGGMLSQINKIIGATNWFDPVQDSGVQPRNLKTITDSIFYKDMLRWRVKVQDITVPAAVKATGTLTTQTNLLQERVTALNEQLDRKRARLLQQFQAMEVALSQLQSQGAALSSLSELAASYGTTKSGSTS